MVHPHPEPEYDSPFSTLRRYIVRGREVRNAARERCELCAAPIPEEHRHMLEVAAREVRCVCRPCALLFEREAASRGKYRLVPERRLHLSDFQLADETWAKLGIPVGLAYLVHDTPSLKKLPQ